MIIIFGLRGRQIELDSGQFHCPSCNTTRSYKHKRAADYFTLFFIPLFPIRHHGEFIECQTCHRAFAPDVKNYRAPSPEDRLLSAVQADLESGTPLPMAQQKLINSGVDWETAQKTLALAVGNRHKTCPNCGLVYHQKIELCSNCGTTLKVST